MLWPATFDITEGAPFCSFGIPRTPSRFGIFLCNKLSFTHFSIFLFFVTCAFCEGVRLFVVFSSISESWITNTGIKNWLQN